MPLNNVKRTDFAVKYEHSIAPQFFTSGSQGVVSQSMPMVSMLLRNKFLAWVTLFTALHSYLMRDKGSNHSTSEKDVHPVFKLTMSIMSVLFCYMSLVFPHPINVSAASFNKN